MPESKCLHCHCTMVHCDSCRCTSRSMHIHRQKYAAATGYRPHRHTHIKHITNCVCVCDSHCLMRFWPKSLHDIQLAYHDRDTNVWSRNKRKRKENYSHILMNIVLLSWSTFSSIAQYIVYVFNNRTWHATRGATRWSQIRHGKKNMAKWSKLSAVWKMFCE